MLLLFLVWNTALPLQYKYIVWSNDSIPHCHRIAHLHKTSQVTFSNSVHARLGDIKRIHISRGLGGCNMLLLVPFWLCCVPFGSLCVSVITNNVSIINPVYSIFNIFKLLNTCQINSIQYPPEGAFRECVHTGKIPSISYQAPILLFLKKDIISVLLTLAKRDLLCGAHLCKHFHILL